jgi:hypothetical protein
MDPPLLMKDKKLLTPSIPKTPKAIFFFYPPEQEV